MAKQRRTTFVNTRLHDTERRAIAQAAAARGMTESAFMRHAALRAAQPAHESMHGASRP